MKSRMASIDFVRVVALLAIVVGHVYTENEFVERAIQSWRLPIFFMLSGYFWSARRTLGEELRKRARSLLLPYVAWLVILTVVITLAAGSGWADQLRRVSKAVVLGGNYAQRPYTTLWFFTGLFAAVVVYRILTRAPAAVRVSVVLAGLAVNVIAGAELARIPYALGTSMSALIFIEAGRLVRQAQSRLSARQLALASGAGVAVARLW